MEYEDNIIADDVDISDAYLRYQQISQRAYELYEARGRVDGHDVEDWLQAEREIISEDAEPPKAAAAGA